MVITPQRIARALKNAGIDCSYIELPGFALFKSTGKVWFRLFGYGLAITSLTGRNMTFSCREGVCRDWHIGRHAVEILRPI